MNEIVFIIYRTEQKSKQALREKIIQVAVGWNKSRYETYREEEERRITSYVNEITHSLNLLRYKY